MSVIRLSRKQSTKNEDWLNAVEHIEETVSKSEIDQLAKQAVYEIKSFVKEKSAAYAWSGGKDSIVLGDLCEKAGVHQSMIGVCDLEYPAFMAWIEQNKPENCEIVTIKLGLDWLVRHEQMLFPMTSELAARWFSIVQHTAQRIYFKDHNLDVLVLGRRHADGNYTGKGNAYTDTKGVLRYSPLAEWKHEHILAYIHYHHLALPPIYTWKNGYVCGTHPWPARQWCGSVENGWNEVYEIDPSIVENAATRIQSARRFLEERR